MDSNIEALLLEDYDPHEDYYPCNESEYIMIEEYEGHDLWVNRLLYDWALMVDTSPLMVDTSPSMVDTSPTDPDSCITYNLIKIACCI